MSDDISPLAQALGRIPTGLYIVSTRHGGTLGSFLMQVGFAPPTVCVAVGTGRGALEAIRGSGRFGVSILDAESRGLMAPFFKSEAPFDEVEHQDAPGGSPVLTGALAWFECEVTGEHDAGDHVVVFGTAVSGAQHRAGDSATHLRKNGLGY